MENNEKNEQKGVPASHFPQGIDQLCDLIISRLEEKWNWGPASQAEGREFEPRLPLHFQKDVSSSGESVTV